MSLSPQQRLKRFCLRDADLPMEILTEELEALFETPPKKDSPNGIKKAVDCYLLLKLRYELMRQTLDAFSYQLDGSSVRRYSEQIDLHSEHQFSQVSWIFWLSKEEIADAKKQVPLFEEKSEGISGDFTGINQAELKYLKELVEDIREEYIEGERWPSQRLDFSFNPLYGKIHDAWVKEHCYIPTTEYMRSSVYEFDGPITVGAGYREALLRNED